MAMEFFGRLLCLEEFLQVFCGNRTFYSSFIAGGPLTCAAWIELLLHVFHVRKTSERSAMARGPSRTILWLGDFLQDIL